MIFSTSYINRLRKSQEKAKFHRTTIMHCMFIIWSLRLNKSHLKLNEIPIKLINIHTNLNMWNRLVQIISAAELNQTPGIPSVRVPAFIRIDYTFTFSVDSPLSRVAAISSFPPYRPWWVSPCGSVQRSKVSPKFERAFHVYIVAIFVRNCKFTRRFILGDIRHRVIFNLTH